MRINLYITAEPENGRPVTLARIADAQLLQAAGRAAIARAYRDAEVMRTEDPVLGQLQQAEATRLQNALELVIPELRSPLLM